MDLRTLPANERDLSPIKALRSPLWVSSLLVLVINDHLLKGAGILPGWLTGKLSDFAGMIVAPVLLATMLRLRTRRGVAVSHLAVGAVFAAIKLLPWAAAALVSAAAAVGMTWKIVCDPTDLIALPTLLASYRLLLPAMERAAAARHTTIAAHDALLAIAGLVGSVATSAVHTPLMTPVQMRTEAPSQDADWNARNVVNASSGGMGAWIASGRAYMTVPNGAAPRTLEAFDLESGRSIWTATPEDEEDGYVAVFAATDHALLVARASQSEFSHRYEEDYAWEVLDLRTGARRFELDIESYEAPVTAAGVFVFVEEDGLVGREASEGDEVWSLDLAAPVARIVADGRDVYVLDVQSQVTRVDGATGQVRGNWPAAGHDEIYRADRQTFAVTADRIAYFAPGKLDVLPVMKGGGGWSRPFAARAIGPADVRSDARSPSIEVVGTAGVLVIVDEANKKLVAFDAQTQALLWERLVSSPLVRVAGAGKLAIVDDRNGNAQQRIQIVDVRSGQTSLLFDPVKRSTQPVTDDGAAVLERAR